MEQREVTIFFADIADFTAIAEQLDADVLSEALGEYLEEMSTVISQGKGTVDKYIGDAIMAFWGAPVALKNHAESACLAALDFQARLKSLREKWHKNNLPPFEARIGINTGPVLVGNIGSTRRMNYTVIGDAVNVASRLEGLCKMYSVQIAIGQRTYELASDCVVARPIDRVAVKGRAQGEVIYELLGSMLNSSDEQTELVELSTRAFDAYSNRNFSTARDHFLEVLRIAPNDGPATRLLERCESFIASPPDDDWDGITILTKK
jgi:adenylate cyclase